MKQYAFLFLLSMVPIVELRAAVPVGLSWNLPFWRVMAVCVIGNCCIIAPAMLFAERVLDAIAKWPYVGAFARKILDRAHRKAGEITGALLVGLFFLVAIPLPGTGAWTGSLVAAILNLPVRRAFWPIVAGVVAAGCIMAAGTFGVFRLIG